MILITGGSGFIGKNLIYKLINLKSIRNFIATYKNSNLEFFKNKKLKYVQLDLRSEIQTKKILEKYKPKVILSGRKINDNMHSYVCSKFMNILKKENIKQTAHLIFFGFTFKENCSDIRNTKIYDLYRELSIHYSNITIYDPVASKADVKKEYGINIINSLPVNKKFDAGILLVAHNEFIQQGYNKITSVLKGKKVFFDFKKVFV